MKAKWPALAALLVLGSATVRAESAPAWLEAVRRCEAQLGVKPAAHASLQISEKAVSFLSQLKLPHTEPAAPAPPGSRPADRKDLVIRSVFNRHSASIEKRVLLENGPWQAAFSMTLEDHAPFVQKKAEAAGVDHYVYESAADDFVYSQVQDQSGDVRLKEWIYAKSPNAAAGSRYVWRVSSPDAGTRVEAVLNPDGSASLVRRMGVNGVDPADGPKQQRILDAVRKALGPKAGMRESQEIARLLPPVYWDAQGRKKQASFRIDGNRLELVLTEAPAAYPLVVDPTLQWGQWMGESNDMSDAHIRAVAVEPSTGEIYAAGYVDTIFNIEGANVLQGTFSGGNTDAFVVEIADGATPSIVWGQLLGGYGIDDIFGMAVNGDEIYVGGITNTPNDWETINWQGTYSGGPGGWEGFVVEIADGTTPALIWGQWLGGTGDDYVRAVAVNGDEIYAAGYSTSSTSWEGTFQGTFAGGNEGFVVEIADGNTPSVAWGEWIGGTGNDFIYGLAVNGDEIYAGGYSDSSTTWEGTFQGTFSSANEGFVVEIADGATPSVAWGQWLGGTGNDVVYSVAVTGDEIYAGGQSASSTSWEGTFQGTFAGTNEGFVVEIADGATPSVAWGQWLGGSGSEQVQALAVNGDEIYAGGFSDSSTSWEGTFQGTFGGSGEGFVVNIADGATPSVAWGQWLGGSSASEEVEALAVNGTQVYATGYSTGPGSTWEGTFQGTHSMSYEGFVVEIADSTTPSINWGQWFAALANANSTTMTSVAYNGTEIYVGGYTNGYLDEFPTFQGAFPDDSALNTEGFVAEVVDTGSTPTLSWIQYLGGSGSDYVRAVAVTGDEIYAAGDSTSSSGWESVTFQGTFSSATEGFVIEIADGTTPSLVWGQWLGGAASSVNNVYAVAVNGDEIYAGGASDSGSSWEGTFQGTHSGGTEGFVVNIADGTTPSVSWGQWLGGTGNDYVRAVGFSGTEIYAAGYASNGTSWEVTLSGTYTAQDEGFLFEIADGATPTINWGQWLGGTGADQILALAVNGDEIYVGGSAPNATTWEVTWTGTVSNTEGFVIEVDDGASPTVRWGEWIGGTGNDIVNAVAVIGDEVYAAGSSTGSSTWESTPVGTFAGTQEGFVAEITDNDGTHTPAVAWAQWLGGSGSTESLLGIAVNINEIYVAGYSDNYASWESMYFGGTGSGVQEGVLVNLSDNLGFTSTQTGNWNAGTTWGTSGCSSGCPSSDFPGASDTANITSTHNVTVTANQSVAEVVFPTGSSGGILTVNSGITLTVGGGITLQSSNTVSTAATIQNGTGSGTVTANYLVIGTSSAPTATVTATLTSTLSNLTINGDVTTVCGTGTSARAIDPKFIIGSGTTTIGGTTYLCNNLNGNAFLQMDQGSQNGTLVFNNRYPLDVVSGATVGFNGTSNTVNYTAFSPWPYSTSYRNLTFSGSGETQLSASVTGALTLSGTTQLFITSDLSVGTITIGANTRFDQSGTVNLFSGAITVNSGGLWSNTGTGDVTLYGNVTNNGIVILDGGGIGCGDADGIQLTSDTTAQRTWSGSGTTSVTDAAVSWMAGAQTAYSSTDSGNNGWTVYSGCSAPPDGSFFNVFNS